MPQDNKNFFAHATNKDALEKILESGRIKSVQKILESEPSQKVDVELLPFSGSRAKMPSDKALRLMSILGKNPDKTFLTKDGVDPRYGDYIIVKRLSSPKPNGRLNFIPNEHITGRELSVKNNARVYVPNNEVDEWRDRYQDVYIKPMDEINIPAFSRGQRAKSLFDKFLSKTASAKQQLEQKIKRDFGPQARLAGSTALGLTINGSDLDIHLNFNDRQEFERKVGELSKTMDVSRDNPDHKVFQGTWNGRPIDVALTYGEIGPQYLDSLERAKNNLSEATRQKIKGRKKVLKNLPLVSDPLYKGYKKYLDNKLQINKI